MGCLGGIYRLSNRLGGRLAPVARYSDSTRASNMSRRMPATSARNADDERSNENRAKADTGTGRNIKSRRVLYGKTFCTPLTQ